MLAPQTLTRSDQEALLQAVTLPRDHLIFSLALGTGLRLAELVGLNVGNVYLNGTPRSRSNPGFGRTPCCPRATPVDFEIRFVTAVSLAPTRLQAPKSLLVTL